MVSGGYYVAIHFLTVWKRLARLAPDQPHGWSFPDALSTQSPAWVTALDWAMKNRPEEEFEIEPAEVQHSRT